MRPDAFVTIYFGSVKDPENAHQLAIFTGAGKAIVSDPQDPSVRAIFTFVRDVLDKLLDAEPGQTKLGSVGDSFDEEGEE